MQFDLISGYSARACWPPTEHATVVECYADDFHTVSTCDQNENSVVVVNLVPGTRYTLKLTLTDGSHLHGEFETCPADSPCLENLYRSTLRQDGVYNTTRFDRATHDVFVSNFSEIVSAGDRILAPVSLRGTKKDILTKAVTDGTTMEIVDDSSLFLPFSDKRDSMQTVTLRRDHEETTMAYDPMCNSVCYRGASYGVGETMEVHCASVFRRCCQGLSLLGSSGSVCGGQQRFKLHEKSSVEHCELDREQNHRRKGRHFCVVLGARHRPFHHI